jgi:hypothetical protein
MGNFWGGVLNNIQAGGQFPQQTAEEWSGTKRCKECTLMKPRAAYQDVSSETCLECERNIAEAKEQSAIQALKALQDNARLTSNTKWYLKHASDCATHNEPALPVGPCDCEFERLEITACDGEFIYDHQDGRWYSRAGCTLREVVTDWCGIYGTCGL